MPDVIRRNERHKMKTLDQVKPIANDLRETEHTPGPWEIPYSPDLIGIVRADGSRKLIAQTHGENFAANARLIAAAPELLAALERWQSTITDEEIFAHDTGECPACGDDLSDCPICMTRHAIANARGEL